MVMKRGFTIVELVVVVSVLVILSGIGISSYTVYRNQGIDSQARSIATAVVSGAERYYNANNEYPSAQVVFGSAPTGSVPASYTTASSVLGVPKDVLDNTTVDLLPCAGTSAVCTPSTLNKARVYYLTKSDPPAATAQTYSVTLPTSTTCTFTFPATETGSMSYLLVFWSNTDNTWKRVRSNKGGITTSNTTNCAINTL